MNSAPGTVPLLPRSPFKNLKTVDPLRTRHHSPVIHRPSVRCDPPMLTAADAAWLSYTITITSSADLPSQSTMRELHSYGRARCAALWTLRYLLAETTRVLPALFADACHPDVTPDRTAQLIATAHAEYVRALTRLTHVSTSFSKPSTVPQSPTTSTSSTVCQRFTNRLRAHLQAKCVTPHLALALYRMFKARVAEGRPRQIEAHLVDLGFARVADDALSWAVFERLDALVASHVSSPTVRAVPDLLLWVRQFTASSSPSSSSSPSLSSSLSSESAVSLWTKRLEFHLHESVCDSRTEQLLSLIEQFPRSIPALHDLRDCFRCTDRKPFVAQSLRRQFEHALLNAGTQTADILQRYVSTIRTLRFLDPSGVVLDCVSAPIRAYLRRRPDTVRCIVSGMTGDGDLYEELQRGRDSSRANSHNIPNTDGAHPTSTTRDACEDNLTTTTTTTTGTTTTTATIAATSNGGGGGGGGTSYDDAAQQQQQQPDLGGNEDDEDHDCQSIDGDVDVKGRVNVAEYEAWEPEPIDAPVRDDGQWRRRGGDAIATLVNIYGSSEQIVAEYRSLLADKLVSQFDVDVAREERILSLLTERFGKTAMHDCVIMLKDVRDSRAVMQQQNDDEDENRERSNANGNEKENEHEIDNANKKQKRIGSKHERNNDENDDDDDDDDGGEVQKHTVAAVRAGTDAGTGSAATSANANHGWFDATVISREFWPKLADEGAFHAPPEIQAQMRTFATAFGRAKKARKLKWLHGLGACRVRLEFDDGRVVNAAVSPMQAAALDVFARVGRVALPDLAKHLGIKDEDQAVLRRKVVALANRGILRLVSPGVYEPVEDGGDMSMGGRGLVASSNRLKNHQSGGSSSTNEVCSAAAGAASQRRKQQQQQHLNGGVVKDNGIDIDVDEIVDVDDDDDDGVFGNGDGADAGDADDEGQREMEVYETYIIAMLTNLKQLSLEQIHTMLKRFIQTPGFDKTQTQLANFLMTLVDKGKVEVAAGIYKVKKKS